MSSFYVLPIDPTAVKSNVTGIDASKLWNSVPKPADSKSAKVGKTHIFYGERTSNVRSASFSGRYIAEKRNPPFRTATLSLKMDIKYHRRLPSFSLFSPGEFGVRLPPLPPSSF